MRKKLKNKFNHNGIDFEHLVCYAEAIQYCSLEREGCG